MPLAYILPTPITLFSYMSRHSTGWKTIEKKKCFLCELHSTNYTCSEYYLQLFASSTHPLHTNCVQTNSLCTPLHGLISRNFLMPSLLTDMKVLVSLKTTNKPSIVLMILANILTIFLNFLSWTELRWYGPLELPLNFWINLHICLCFSFWFQDLALLTSKMRNKRK